MCASRGASVRVECASERASVRVECASEHASVRVECASVRATRSLAHFCTRTKIVSLFVENRCYFSNSIYVFKNRAYFRTSEKVCEWTCSSHTRTSTRTLYSHSHTRTSTRTLYSHTCTSTRALLLAHSSVSYSYSISLGGSKMPTANLAKKLMHSKRSTRTISAKGCTSKLKSATLPAFRALDTHDLRRGFTFSKPCFRSAAPATKSWAEVIRNAALAAQKHPQAQVPKMQPL